jgi:peptidoglycan/xylan/chitin deacetylase (PgdA/CDA1 family)
MSLRDHLGGPALALWRLARPFRPTGSLRILILHDVPPAQRPVLAATIAALAAAELLVEPAMAARRLVEGSERDGVLLSFDDGFVSNLEVAETILAPLGAKALFFVCPGLIDLDQPARMAAIAANILRGRRQPPEDLMDWQGVERLVALGHTIGSHTSDHRCLAGMSSDQLSEQVGDAAATLARRLGGKPDWFAYTFGDIGSIDAAALAEIGRHHRFCRSGVRGGNTAATPRLALRGDHLDLTARPAWRDLTVEGGLAPLYGRQRRRLDAMAP